MRKLLLVCFILLFLPLQHIFAVGEFQADYDVEYAIAPTGVTIVTQNVTLTNLQSNLYPKQYSITIDTEKIQNVIARDAIGIMSPTISQHDGKTDITLPFNSQAVGLGKQTTFTLRYDNLDIATKNGTVWEVNIPGVTETPDVNRYSVSLQVPPSFGPNAYMSPMPGNGRKWTKDQMIQGGISAAYGAEQIFSLKLRYFLENTRVTPAYQEIALPPDTAFQKVILNSITPKPTSVRRDADGNWLARYDLGPATQLTVTAQIAVVIGMAPRPEWHQEDIDATAYTKELPYWTSDQTIETLAKTYKTPEAIYDYVVKTLGYDYTRVAQNPIRKGAVEALKSPKQSVCMEFTDLFIAIARATGIPAREAVGYAYTTNTKLRPLSLIADVLHSWPEYWNTEKKIWIPVDPTWGNTTGGVDYFNKLDFNHIVFAIHGLGSTSPYPAGAYHQVGDTAKDVDVSFLDKVPPSSPATIKTTIQFPKIVTAGATATGFVTVMNTSSTAANDITTVVQAAPFGTTKTWKETMLPPFGVLTYPLEITVDQYFTQGTGRIHVTTNDQTASVMYEIRPVYWAYVPALLGLLATVLIIMLVLSRKKLWRFLKHR